MTTSQPSGTPTEPLAVLVTGASSGIGRATVRLFAERGANIVLVARGQSALDDAAEEARAAGAGAAVVVPADVTDEVALGAAFDAATSRFGRLDVVVHAAQVMAYGTIEEVPGEVFRTVVQTAVEGTFNVARLALPVFRRQRGGHLVVVSSLLAEISAPYMGSYVTAKWAQLGLLRTLQQEVRDAPGVHVSAVSPGGVSTPIYKTAGTYIGRTGRPPFPVYSADRVARSVVARLDHPRRIVQSGFANPLVIAGFRLVPAVFDALVGPLLKAFGTDRDGAEPTEGNVFTSRPERYAVDGQWRGL